MRDNTIEAFFALVRAGLFTFHCDGFKVNDSLFRDVEWEKVYLLAQEQSVQGLVLAGLEYSDIKPPKELLLQWIGEVQMIEQKNRAMNAFINQLIGDLRKANIYILIVKGQGIAQCYERPLWRTCGDVDLFLSKNNYEKAKAFLSPLASSIQDEEKKRFHLSMTIDSWEVELHGTLKTCLWRNLDKVIDELHKEVFCGGAVRSWMNGKTQVFIPRADEDVVFVFAHILQHFYLGGVGLRQICDWCRLLWMFRESLNYGLLESRIREMGIMSEWKAFAYLAVNCLGMPVESMPLYSSSPRWNKKANVLLGLILEMGNMGHSRDIEYQYNKPASLRRAITFWRLTKDKARQLLISPINPIRVWCNMVWSKLFH